MSEERVKVPPVAVDRLRTLFAASDKAAIAAAQYAAGVMDVAAPGRTLAGIDDATDELLLAPLEESVGEME